MSRYQVTVYDPDSGDAVARVQYNADLDYWDGRNHTNGGMGKHRGITKLKDGRYVIILGSDFAGTKDTAHIVSKEEALKEIVKSDNFELLKTKKFAELKELYDSTIGSLGEEEE
jgi:hypothetical protein